MSLTPLAFGLSNVQAVALRANFDTTVSTYANLATLGGYSPSVQPTFTTTVDGNTSGPMRPGVNTQGSFVVTSVVITNTSANALSGANFSIGWATSATATPSALMLSADTSIASLAAGATAMYTFASTTASPADTFATATTGLVKATVITNNISSATAYFLNCKVAAGTASTAAKVDVFGYFQPLAA